MQKIFLMILLCCISLHAAIPTKVHIRGQIGKAVIDETQKSIIVQVNYYGKNGVYPLKKAVVEIFELSEKTSHTLPDTLNLVSWTSFKIGTEDWKIKGGYQLPHSDFQYWHSEKVKGFATFGTITCDEMVGSAKQRIWDNGNPAYSTSGSKNWPTYKTKLKDGSYAAELTTRSILGIIASGNLFTGRIVRDMSLKQLLGFTDKDGKSLIRWGVPFEGRPIGFEVKFKYEGKGDSCTLTATLENQKQGIRHYIATAWYNGKTDNEKNKEGVISISEPDKNDLRTLKVKFLYGKRHKNADPLPEGVAQGNPNEEITHINVVFASSQKGDFFKGVKGAKLIVKDFKLLY